MLHKWGIFNLILFLKTVELSFFLTFVFLECKKNSSDAMWGKSGWQQIHNVRLLQCYCNILTMDYIQMVYFISFQIMCIYIYIFVNGLPVKLTLCFLKNSYRHVVFALCKL